MSIWQTSCIDCKESLNMADFELDSRLSLSSVWVADLPLSELRLKNHAHYPWCILIPRVDQVTELYQLTPIQQQQLIQEITKVSSVMQALFKPTKLNVASLGNIVSQLHIHIVGRSDTDPLWPQGIWQNAAVEIPYTENELQERIQQLQKAIG